MATGKSTGLLRFLLITQLILHAAHSIKEIKQSKCINIAALLFGCRMDFFYQIVKFLKKIKAVKF